jgi:uncharacterized protein (TIGR03435 family)
MDAIVALILMMSNAPAVPAQLPPAAVPAFEVASIKPARAGQRGGSVSTLLRSGRLIVQSYNLTLLVRTAYQVRVEDISGGPDWRETDRYDIEAKAEGSVATEETLFFMLRSLLADRFKLSVHREKKEIPVYHLVIAKKEPKLQPAKDADSAQNQPGPRGGFGGAGAPCWTCGSLRVQVDAAGGRRIIGRASMPELANFFARLAGRPVLDRTGIAGVFDIKLEWVPLPDEFSRSTGSADPEMMSAIQEQLGLRLENQKGAGEILVIDRAEKPAEN